MTPVDVSGVFITDVVWKSPRRPKLPLVSKIDVLLLMGLVLHVLTDPRSGEAFLLLLVPFCACVGRYVGVGMLVSEFGVCVRVCEWVRRSVGVPVGWHVMFECRLARAGASVRVRGAPSRMCHCGC